MDLYTKNECVIIKEAKCFLEKKTPKKKGDNTNERISN